MKLYRKGSFHPSSQSVKSNLSLFFPLTHSFSVLLRYVHAVVMVSVQLLLLLCILRSKDNTLQKGREKKQLKEIYNEMDKAKGEKKQKKIAVPCHIVLLTFIWFGPFCLTFVSCTTYNYCTMSANGKHNLPTMVAFILFRVAITVVGISS